MLRRPGPLLPSGGDTRGWTGAGYVGESSPEEEAAFADIRAKTGDVARIAANTGINEEVLTQAKTHLFMTTHDVPIAAGQIAHGYFTADGETAAQWARAENGTLNRAQAIRFRGLIAHEYVESRLVESGVPYRSAHPAAWDGDYQEFSTVHFGAHEVAPKSADGSMTLWGDLGLTPPDEPIAPDVSNLDNVVEAARRGLDL
jgi:hypothetical protein